MACGLTRWADLIGRGEFQPAWTFFGFAPDDTPRRARETDWAAWKPANGELRSPDKLKHVPQCAARKLSAVGF
jgi:hypothetical protein